MSENDPIKRLFSSLPEIEPRSGFKESVLEKIRNRGFENPFWVLKPVFALGSLVIVSLLGTLVSLNLVSKRHTREKSPIVHWAEGQDDSQLLKGRWNI